MLPSRLAAANRAAGNRDDAPAIELLGRLVVRDDDGRESCVESHAWSYVAVARRASTSRALDHAAAAQGRSRCADR